jgi:hypothetical protein
LSSLGSKLAITTCPRLADEPARCAEGGRLLQ